MANIIIAKDEDNNGDSRKLNANSNKNDNEERKVPKNYS